MNTARRLTLAPLVSLCVLAGALTLLSASAGAADLHEFLPGPSAEILKSEAQAGSPEAFSSGLEPRLPLRPSDVVEGLTVRSPDLGERAFNSTSCDPHNHASNDLSTTTRETG
jgi:hypothetical protein